MVLAPAFGKTSQGLCDKGKVKSRDFISRFTTGAVVNSEQQCVKSLLYYQKGDDLSVSKVQSFERAMKA